MINTFLVTFMNNRGEVIETFIDVTPYCKNYTYNKYKTLYSRYRILVQ